MQFIPATAVEIQSHEICIQAAVDRRTRCARNCNHNIDTTAHGPIRIRESCAIGLSRHVGSRKRSGRSKAVQFTTAKNYCRCEERPAGEARWLTAKTLMRPQPINFHEQTRNHWVSLIDRDQRRTASHRPTNQRETASRGRIPQKDVAPNMGSVP